MFFLEFKCLLKVCDSGFVFNRKLLLSLCGKDNKDWVLLKVVNIKNWYIFKYLLNVLII